MRERVGTKLRRRSAPTAKTKAMRWRAKMMAKMGTDRAIVISFWVEGGKRKRKSKRKRRAK